MYESQAQGNVLTIRINMTALRQLIADVHTISRKISRFAERLANKAMAILVELRKFHRKGLEDEASIRVPSDLFAEAFDLVNKFHTNVKRGIA